MEVEISDSQCWAYIFDAFGGERHTPPAIDRRQKLADAIRKAYAAGLAAAPANEAALRNRLVGTLRVIAQLKVPEYNTRSALEDAKGIARHALWLENLLPPAP